MSTTFKECKNCGKLMHITEENYDKYHFCEICYNKIDIADLELLLYAIDELNNEALLEVEKRVLINKEQRGLK